jgi:rifampicin phosphotransferase
MTFRTGVLALGVWLVSCAQAHAIPSPELIVGSLSSLSQLGALLAATLGGGALLASARGNHAAKSARRAWIAVGALGLVAGLLAGILVWHIADRAADRQARLEATLLRPARQPGQQIADPTLKELSFRDQQKHPLGMTTSDAAHVLGSPSHMMVDVREDAEIEMGSLPGVKPIRFPDFNAEDPAYQGKTLVFFCHNGNRSHETCEALKAKGIDCRFIVGGLEKWVVEKRAMTGLQSRTLADLRAIPTYPNRDRLLDTPEVKTLITRDNAQIVDVRYPGEFATGHLPAAVNIPLRRLSRVDLDQQLTSLPRTPVILPCYDRRSCFFAEVMGLELTRAGHAVAGRYTEPFAYFVPAPRPPHVEAWIADTNRSLWQKARDSLTAGVLRVANIMGLPLALLLLALASRFAILPFAIKSERDQMIAQMTAHEVDALKSRLSNDPIRLRRALSDYAKRHNLTPLRNLAALAFLPVLALSVLAAGDAAKAKPVALAWVPDLAAPDPRVALPLMFAALFTLYCIAAIARTQRQALLTAVIAIPTLAIMTAKLPAAAALYLNISAALLIAQRAWVAQVPYRLVTWLTNARRNWHERSLAGAMFLDRPTGATDIGNKADRLASLSAAGFPVPAALALDHVALTKLLALPQREQDDATHRMALALGGTTFAVRSSAANEDSASSSFAGVFDSLLHVKQADLPTAIQRVAASFASARAAAYVSDGGHGNIIIQRMLAPQYAGILFTRAPDAPGQMLVEMVEGTADKLAAGQATPASYRFGRLTLAPIGPTAPLDLAPVLRLGQHIADHFGKPQDIEWAYADGSFHILQTRDIAADVTERTRRNETEALLHRARRAPAKSSTILLHASSMTELLPRPTTVSLDVLNALWAPGSSVDLACRRLGLDYVAHEDDPPLYTRVNGRLMTDTRLEAARSLRLTPRQRRRLADQAAVIATEMRSTLLPTLRAEAIKAAALDLTKLTFTELSAHWHSETRRFLHETHTHAEVINILAVLAASSDGDTVSSHRPAWHETLLEAAQSTQRMRSEAMQRIAGHRSNLDYELAHPRWSEVPGAVESFAANLKPRKAEPMVPGSAADLAALKEDAKHEVLRSLAHLRTTLLELDHRLCLGGHIFELTIDEIGAATLETAEALQVATRERRHTIQFALQEPPPPPRMTARDIEALGTPAFAEQYASIERVKNGRCKGRGVRVSGRNEVAGRAFVATLEQAETGIALDGFRDGDILVAPMVHPDWLGHVLRAGGVIADTGGWLSHMAIVAREYGVAMIVGIPNAGQFNTGDRIRLMPDGKILAETEALARLNLVAG